MGKIYCMMGKSSSGKDTLYQKVLERLPQIHRVVPYTTRPIREGEQDGVEYHFVDDKQLAELETDGKIVELRAYNTVHGAEHLVPIYIEVEDGERLARALERERRQAVPKYKEMCRRFLADEEDFCEENLKRLGIDKRYRNTDMETCLNEITGVMCNGKF